MRRFAPIAVAVTVLAGCGGGLSAPTYPTAQAYRIVAGCMKNAGATSVRPLGKKGGDARFAAGGSVRWGYVMSGSRVSQVFFADELGSGVATRTKLNACLKPRGWSGA